jgi:hypothetical protein
MPGWPFLRHHMQYLRQCQAAGTSHSKFHFSQQPQTSMARLRVKGIMVDYVDGVAASRTSDDFPLIPRHRNRRYEDSAEALGKTLVFCHPRILGRPMFMKTPWNFKDCSLQSAFPSPEYLQFEKFRKLRYQWQISKILFSKTTSNRCRNWLAPTPPELDPNDIQKQEADYE